MPGVAQGMSRKDFLRLLSEAHIPKYSRKILIAPVLDQPKDSKRFQRIPKDSKESKRLQKDSNSSSLRLTKEFQRI